MRIVFFGSAAIGFPFLERLLASAEHELVGVVTQPDRPVGRKLKQTPCPVKSFAEERGIPVLSPEKIGSAESLDALNALGADLFVVIAYGQYIPLSVLALPQHPAINLHPSLLPKYRGAAPIQWALANGDDRTGVSIIYVVKKMDSGDILRQRELAVSPGDTALTLEPILAQMGAEELMVAIDQIRDGVVDAWRQDEARVVEVRKLTKADGCLDWTLSASALNNRIRGFAAWPGCFFESGSLRVKVFSASVEEGIGPPGEILAVNGAGPLIATGDGALRLLSVQPAGKRAMDGAAFLRGYPLHPGDSLAG